MTTARSIKFCITISLTVVAPFVGLAVGGCGDAQGVAASRASDARSAATTAETPGKQAAATDVGVGDAPTSDAIDPDSPVTATSEAEITQVAQGDPPNKTAAAKPRGVRSISFDDIKFDLEKDATFERTMLTSKIEGYDGTRIRIRGFILPSFKQDGLTEFVLVRDNMECCFGPGAALCDCIMVRMKPGKSTSYSIRPVSVEGTFTISEWKDFDGVVRAIYHVDGEEVK